jgi:hypothetical protein
MLDGQKKSHRTLQAKCINIFGLPWWAQSEGRRKR